MKKETKRPAWRLHKTSTGYEYQHCLLSIEPGSHPEQVRIMNEVGQKNITEFVMQLVKDREIFEKMVAEHDRLLREIQKMFRAGQIIMNIPEEDLDGENPLAAIDEMNL